MADYEDSKQNLGSLYPTGAVDSSWSRLEPLITPEDMREIHLFGIPLVSFIKDPVTMQRQAMSDRIIEKKIIGAVALVEAELGMQVFPTQHMEKLAFDKNEFQSLGYFKLKNRPISSIERLAVVPANGLEIYVVPNDWIETANLSYGQINIIPLNIATTGGSFIPAAQSGGGAFFLSILGQRPWIAAFWQVTYTTGWPEGKIPRMVNELIATVAAMDILSLLAATYARSTSHSLGIDSLSQSISTPGPQLFLTRIEELEKKKTMLVRKLKAMFGLLLFSNNV